MRQFNQVLLIAALTRAPFTRDVPLNNPKGDVKSLFSMEATLGVISQRPNGSVITSYTPITMTGEAARNLHARLDITDNKLNTPVALIVDGAYQRDAWIDTETGKEKSRLKIRANHVEIAAGEHTFVTDSAGGYRLQNGTNSAFIGGNLTRDVEVKVLPNGDHVADLDIALNRSYVLASGERKEDVTYVQVTVWREVAQSAAGLKKGAAVLVQGAVTSESWNKKDGSGKDSTIKMEGYSLSVIQTPAPKDGSTTPTAGVVTTTTPQVDEADLPPTVEEELPF